MGFFTAYSAKRVSKKPPELWTREHVVRWLKCLGMDKYEDGFRPITGRRLLQLTSADLCQLTDSKLDADLLMDAIEELRGQACQDKREDTPTMNALQEQALPLVHVIMNGAPADNGGMKSAPVSDGGEVPSSDNGLSGMPASSFSGSKRQSPAASSATLSTATTTISTAFARGTQENAEMLSGLVGGHEVVTELFAYMNFLGIQGMGLVQATERSPIVGHIIGALWELHDLVQSAKGNWANCQQLDAYGQDILRVFDAEGKRLAFLNNAALTTILQSVEEGIALVEGCCRSGWLLRMATNERSMQEFQAVHNSVLVQLRAEKVDTLPNGRQLTYGEYHDATRSLRRCLRQLGSGSLEDGLQAVNDDDKALMEVAQLIHVDKQFIRKDLTTVSAKPSGNDIMATQDSATLDLHAAVGSGGALVTGRGKEYQTIFSQYDKNLSGALEFEELRSVLADLGLLDGIKPTDIEASTLQQFSLADTDQDGRVDFDEFVSYYQALSTTKARRELRTALGPQAEKDLKRIFCSFASFGGRQHIEEMDGAKFSKLCRDCKLLSRAFTTIDVDLIFARAKIKGQRKVSFDQFLSALVKVAEKKGQALEEVVRTVLAAGGPSVSGTKADYVKFHDDKSTYTGVYARGGPTNIEPSRELSALLDRSDADVRGVKRSPASSSKASQNDPPLSARGTPQRSHSLASSSGKLAPTPPSSTKAALPSAQHLVRSASSASSQSIQNIASPLQPTSEAPSSDGATGTPAAEPAVDLSELQAAFAGFLGVRMAQGSASGVPLEMDGAKFAKLCRDSGLLHGRLNSTAADIIFTRVKTKGKQRITYAEFQHALQLIAQEKGVSLDAVQTAIVTSGGPRPNTRTTMAPYVRLHDDKSTHTGVYARGGPSNFDSKLTLQSLTDRTNRRTSQ